MFSLPTASLTSPQGPHTQRALAACRHVCVAAHPDDAEFMALQGAAQGAAFAVAVLTDGAGAGNPGERAQEALQAARTGSYAGLALLMHSSQTLKAPTDRRPDADLDAFLGQVGPLDTAYIHNPFDRHPTHVAASLRALKALRRLPEDRRPAKVIGCEMWGGLDWLPEECRVDMVLDGLEPLFLRLVASYPSQTSQKNYVQALLGRWRANASFINSHDVDKNAMVAFGLNLSVLVSQPELPIDLYLKEILDKKDESLISAILSNLA